jgi:NADH-quinone oxidoreductase subunit K
MEEVSITNFYLCLSICMFCMGTYGVLIRKNAIVIFMCIELMLNSANIAFVALSRQFGDVDSQIFVFFVMAVAAAEAAVGLAIILAVFRHYRTVEADQACELKG